MTKMKYSSGVLYRKINFGCLLALLFLLLISCGFASPSPTATPIGVRLDVVPVRFQGDWSLNVPPPDNLYEEAYAEYSGWYERLVVHIDELAVNCKVLEQGADGELQELETAVSVQSIYQGIEIRFETMIVAPLDYFDGEEQRKAGFSHGEVGQRLYYQGVITLVPYGANE